MTTSQPTGSGADLARMALAAARANAKHNPAPAAKKTRRPLRPVRGQGRDPQGLATVLGKLTAEQGWDAGINGGNLIDQWSTIAPTELAATVQPVTYDPDHGILELRPSSPAYATQVRLFQHQLVAHLNRALGRPAVRSIRVLPPGGTGRAVAAVPDTPTSTQPAGPVKTRETAHPGYRQALTLARENRLERPDPNPYVEEARQRQIAALRANRLPETEHRAAEWVGDQPTARPTAGSSEASRQAALAYKRRAQAGLEPRRLSGAA